MVSGSFSASRLLPSLSSVMDCILGLKNKISPFWPRLVLVNSGFFVCLFVCFVCLFVVFSHSYRKQIRTEHRTYNTIAENVACAMEQAR